MYAVVPAGGSGTRLWPLSRAADPKFLHPLAGDGRSLIRATFDRLAPLAAPEQSYVVTGGAHAAGIARELPELPAGNLLVEPSPRDSAPAIGLAAALIHRRDPEAVMGSFAADHLVRDEEGFVDVLHRAAALAADGFLVTVGITPTAPETGYGYIRRGVELGRGGHRVEQFTEKPPRDVAECYLASGEYLWNASMFVWRTAEFLGELARQLPDLFEGLQRIAADWDGARREQTLAAVWPTLPKVSVDHGIMEDAGARGRVATVPGGFGWNDIGDWDTLASVLPHDDAGNSVLDTDWSGELRTVEIDTAGTLLVPGSGRLVATLGVRDLVIVDTPDAVFVAPRARAQDVRKMVEELRSRGDDHL